MESVENLSVNGYMFHTLEYKIWSGMLEYCSNSENSGGTIYTMSESFKNFDLFYKWFNNEVGSDNYRWHFSNSILFENSTIYSEETCCIVPTVIATILLFSVDDAKKLSVSYNNETDKYEVISEEFFRQINYGLYNTPEEAHAVWAARRNVYVQEVAEMYKGRIREEVYQKLKNYIAS